VSLPPIKGKGRASRYLNGSTRSSSNIIAGMFNFKAREFFEISAPAEREAPKVSFGGATT
jgi:hypothetical protein